jgi:hypothetical protein
VSAFIDAHRGRFGVEFICQTIGVSASAYYQRVTGERLAREVEDERLLERIREVHEASYSAYGYRRTWKALLIAMPASARERGGAISTLFPTTPQLAIGARARSAAAPERPRLRRCRSPGTPRFSDVTSWAIGSPKSLSMAAGTG